MAEPECPQKEPYSAEVRAGRTYYWCSCGKSARQPFCDGSHDGTSFEPVEFKATEAGTVWFCGCKATASKPLCDGSHNQL